MAWSCVLQGGALRIQAVIGDVLLPSPRPDGSHCPALQRGSPFGNPGWSFVPGALCRYHPWLPRWWSWAGSGCAVSTVGAVRGSCAGGAGVRSVKTGRRESVVARVVNMG